MACGSIASTGGQLVSYPMHVVKSRLIMQGMDKNHPSVYSGVTNALILISWGILPN